MTSRSETTHLTRVSRLTEKLQWTGCVSQKTLAPDVVAKLYLRGFDIIPARTTLSQLATVLRWEGGSSVLARPRRDRTDDNFGTSTQETLPEARTPDFEVNRNPREVLGSIPRAAHHLLLHWLSSGRLHCCHQCDPGSTPGCCISPHLASPVPA